jgi:LAO/AO transport system kinase
MVAVEHEAPRCTTVLPAGPATPASLASRPARLAPARHAPRTLSVDDHVFGVLQGDRTVLARTITLIESKSAAHEEKAQAVLQRLLPHTGKARRIGISGVPGAGKSTLVEVLGCLLCERAHKVAVLTIDPSSARTGGSILGDKTRMERLNREPNAFIRPSPSGASLGGVARRTRETMLVCEAAGFDTVLVETVGVGQSEVTVRSMTDFFLLVLVPGAGDELQGIKKGIMELADTVLVNKAEGDNRVRAEQSRAEYAAALHYLAPASPPWKTEVCLASALTGAGVPELWDTIGRFFTQLEPAGAIARRRQHQALDWLHALLREELERRFFRSPEVKPKLARAERGVLAGELTAVSAARMLLEAFDHQPAAAAADAATLTSPSASDALHPPHASQPKHASPPPPTAPGGNPRAV